MNFKDIVISYHCTLRETLVQLDKAGGSNQTLFVINDQEQVIGSITDGDIRRALIKRGNLDEHLDQFCHREFRFFNAKNLSLSTLKEFKAKGLEIIPYLNEEGRIVRIYKLSEIKSLLPLDAVLMAGGKGERLRPLTEKTPKPLLKVGDKSIIDYNIDNLIQFGVENISVTVNYLGEQIEKHFEASREGIKIRCVREPQYLGTIGSIKFVDNFRNDTVLLMNSDLFTNINFEDFYLHFKENNADMSIAAIPYSVTVPYGIFELEEREIKGIKEKPTYNYYANSGIYLIKRELLDLIPDGIFYNATDFIEKLVKENYHVVRFPLMGYWIDIGKHEDYKRAQEFVKHL
ncbi:MAG: nucleotidyltransferase family protein [Odoribacter sp.]